MRIRHFSRRLVTTSHNPLFELHHQYFGPARGLADGELDLEALSTVDDETVSFSLQQLRGVGRWSAEYALFRGLDLLGVFPGDDVGARNNWDDGWA
jgi:3-methyladenine DNA glycosylase/8-oxoguanine DNA glycosylase